MNSRRVAPPRFAWLPPAGGRDPGCRSITASRIFRLRFFRNLGNIRKCQPAGMHMHAAEFGAAMQGRKHFSGVEQALRHRRRISAAWLLIEVRSR